MKKVILYNSYFSEMGGIETFTYNFCRYLRGTYDITVLVDQTSEAWKNKLSEIVTVKVAETKPIECDVLIMTRMIDPIPKYIRYKKVIRRLHSNKYYDIQTVPQDADAYVCVSEMVKDSFGLTDATVIHNMVYNRSDEALLLMSCTRIPAPDKGENVDRMRKLGKMLDDANISYLWLNFSDNPMEDPPKHFVNVGHTLDVQHYMRKADYIVQLSTVEACSNTVLEALYFNVPLICTPVPSFFELGVKDGENAYVVPFNMNFDVNKLLDWLVYCFRYDNGSRIRKWKEVIDG